MTTWKDGGGNYDLLCRKITNEAGDCAICKVWTRQFAGRRGNTIEPWPEGEANYRLILKAPELLAALEAIAALTPGVWCREMEDETMCDQCQEIAHAAIAAVKGES